MIDLKSRLQITLQTAGYSTWLTAVDDVEVVGFEDAVVMGFACLFEDANALLNNWRAAESRLLAKHAQSLQRAGEKSWNVYSIFLSSGAAPDGQAAEVRWIEEDLERTRKLAACGISDEEGLIKAVLPLLPLQSQAVLDREEFDLMKRLTRRIESIAAPIAKIALDSGVSPADVIRALGADV